MNIIDVRNVHNALPEALRAVSIRGAARDSRNGEVVKFEGPLTTRYRKPCERVMFWKDRDANPFFHFFESLWMLNGDNDVRWPATFAQNIKNYSDNGHTFHGAYGHRWRRHFGIDQLFLIADALRRDPDCRRQVLQMWDTRVDLGRKGKDVPCNVEALFQVNEDGELDMVVYNRSNDLVWGAYGANAVHFSFLQEYMANAVGVPVGHYWQIAFNAHFYRDTYEKVEHLAEESLSPDHIPRDPYSIGAVAPFPICTHPGKSGQALFDAELAMFMEEARGCAFRDRFMSLNGLSNPFFRYVARPMLLAWLHHKNKDYKQSLESISKCIAMDWRLACTEWLGRRAANAKQC